jgi:hypothetical protein
LIRLGGNLVSQTPSLKSEEGSEISKFEKKHLGRVRLQRQRQSDSRRHHEKYNLEPLCNTAHGQPPLLWVSAGLR